MPVNRTLFASTRTCRFGCVYCFAKFDSFAEVHPLPKFAENDWQDGHVIYPTCDGEFFSDPEAPSELQRLVDSSRESIFVSISVKSGISKRQASLLGTLNDQLQRDSRGLIKCSISLSAKKDLDAYEPKTPDYDQRLNALKRLADENIPRSVNLKPVLPSVQASEYQEIILDTAPYTSVYLTGGLWLDAATEFGRQIKAQYPSFISLRSVDWLPNRPQWEYCENELQTDAILKAIADSGCQAFETDLQVMNYLLSLVPSAASNEAMRINKSSAY
jgi:hypothetical protein